MRCPLLQLCPLQNVSRQPKEQGPGSSVTRNSKAAKRQIVR